YYEQYVSRVPDVDILELLASQGRETLQLLETIDEEKAQYRYEAGKWSIKELVGHVSDVERVFAYRALVFARNDTTPQAGIEQDDYVAHANFDARALRSIATEFASVRAATLSLFEGLGPDTWMRRGKASGFDFTVRSIPYILAGHEIHHVAVLRQRYLGG
ncbi:MAG: DinB family protein, partial [Candidatus Latescibacterota bacterium]